MISRNLQYFPESAKSPRARVDGHRGCPIKEHAAGMMVCILSLWLRMALVGPLHPVCARSLLYPSVAAPLGIHLRFTRHSSMLDATHATPNLVSVYRV